MVDINGNVNPTFHVVFREDDGTPLIGGSVYWRKDTDHGTFKAVYEDRARTIPLPNPTPLNAAGIVSDAGGAPKPVYLADDENYYVEVYRAGESPPSAPIQTVPNWNADAAFSITPEVDEIVTTNFIPNAQFRSLINGKTIYTNDELNATNNILIARNDWYLRRDVLTSTNRIEFKEFIVGQTEVPFNPKYYLNFSCGVISTETIKDHTVDIGDVESFSNQEMTFAIYARSSTNSIIEILTDQDYGSGGSTQDLTIIDSFQLTSSFAQYKTTFTVADVSGKSIGTDNKFRIRVRVPLNAICDIDFTESQLNVGNTILEFDYQPSIDNDGNASKDAIPQPTSSDAGKSLTIDSDNIKNIWASNPPIGSVIDYAASTEPNGWLECDHGSYDGYEDQPQHNLWLVIKNKYGYGDDGFAGFDETGQINIFNSKKDTNTTDIIDGTTGFTFETVHNGGDLGFLTQTQYDFLGDGTLLGLDTLRVENKSNGFVTAAGAGTSGFTITQVQFGTGLDPEIVDIIPTVGAGLAGKYFEISSTIANYYVWFEVNGSGADPAVGGRTGIKIAIGPSSSVQEMIGYIYWALGGVEHSKIVCNAASTLTASDYFLIYNSTDTIVFWYRISEIGTEPVVTGTKIPIDVLQTDTSTQVATKTNEMGLRSFQFNVPETRGLFIRGWNHGKTNPKGDPDADSRYMTLDFLSKDDNVGTLQIDEFRSHTHAPSQNIPANRTNGAGGSTDYWAGIGPAGTTTLNNSGGFENRPINIYMMKIIKY